MRTILSIRNYAIFGLFVAVLGTSLFAAEPIVLKGHTKGVTSVCFSSDGKKVLTGSMDKTARIWDARTGKELLIFAGHTDWVTSVCFSPDGKKVLTGSFDETARIWDAGTGIELLKITGHTSHVMFVCFSPDGKKVLTGSRDKTARIWDAGTGKELLKLEHTNRVYPVCFSSDGKKVMTGSDDRTARIWDAETGKELLKLKHPSFVRSVCFSPDGKKVLTGDWDETARIWDAESGKELLKFRGSESGNEASSDCFSPDGKKVLTGIDNSAQIMDAETGKKLLELKGHTSHVKSVCFSTDGKKVLTGGWDNTARIWDVDALEQSISNEAQRQKQIIAYDAQLRKNAENGTPEEQFKLGNRYYNGDGVSKNVEEALTWWKKAGLRGHQGAVDALQKHAKANVAAGQRREEEGKEAIQQFFGEILSGGGSSDSGWVTCVECLGWGWVTRQGNKVRCPRGCVGGKVPK
ncbi:MAG: hypothetical protein LBP59_00720 [Planctomycetaceae bacterium]|jgi:WD40 repeat protein|nr:hypothetical protein [Planctomycetaceae bacterium]